MTATCRISIRLIVTHIVYACINNILVRQFNVARDNYSDAHEKRKVRKEDTPSFASSLSAQGIIGKMKNSVPQVYHELKRNIHVIARSSREVHSSVAMIDSECPNGGDEL